MHSSGAVGRLTCIASRLAVNARKVRSSAESRKRSSRADDGLAEVREVVTRATRRFVGTYFERDGDALVRVDGQIFTQPWPACAGRQCDAKRLR